MTADLVARLEKAAAHPLLHESDARLFREAASALRSSGEAVAWRYLQPVSSSTYAWTRWLEMCDLRHYGVDGNLVAGPHPDWKVEYAYPATPASAWRPIAEAPGFRDGTIIVTNRLGEVAPMVRGVIQNESDWTFGEAITEWQPLPPTSTKA